MAFSAVTEIFGNSGLAELAQRPSPPPTHPAPPSRRARAQARGGSGLHTYLPIEHSERAQLLQAHGAVGLCVVGFPRVGCGLVHIPGLHHGGGGFH